MTKTGGTILQKLVSGLRLESIRLSLGSVTLEFGGMRDSEDLCIEISTSHNVCCRAKTVFVGTVGDDADELKLLYESLECDFLECRFGADDLSVEIKLSRQRSIYVWSDSPRTDNLLLYRDWNTSAWGVLG